MPARYKQKGISYNKLLKKMRHEILFHAVFSCVFDGHAASFVCQGVFKQRAVNQVRIMCGIETRRPQNETLSQYGLIRVDLQVK